jgi:hypothetical protein
MIIYLPGLRSIESERSHDLTTIISLILLMQRRPGIPDRVLVAETLGDFNWTASPAGGTFNRLFQNYQLSFNELIHIVRTFLEFKKNVTTIEAQNIAIGREPLRRKSMMQKWIHEHWEEMRDFCCQVVLEIPTGGGKWDIIGPLRSEFLDQRRSQSIP